MMTSQNTVREVEKACRKAIRQCRANSGRASFGIWMRAAHRLLVQVQGWRSLSADEADRLARCEAEAVALKG